MRVNIKKLHEDAVIPSYAKPGDAGMDLTAISVEKVPIGSHHLVDWKLIYGTGLAFEIPEGHVGLLYPRSSIHKVGLVLTNHVGVADSGYRGEIKFVFRKLPGAEPYKVGDRIGQIMIVPYPKIEFNEVEELSETARGTGGFGSTGK